MKTITVDLPDTVDAEANELRLLLAAKMYELGRLSLGQAAEMAGLSKRSFAEVLHTFRVSLFNFDLSEIEADLKNA